MHSKGPNIPDDSRLETDRPSHKTIQTTGLRGGCPGFRVSREPRIRVFIGKQRGKGTRMTSDTGYVGTPPSRISPSKMPTAYLLVPPRRGLQRPPVLPAIKTVLNHPRSCNAVTGSSIRDATNVGCLKPQLGENLLELF